MKTVILLSLILLCAMYSRASDNLCSRRTMLPMSMVSGNRQLSTHSIQRFSVKTLTQCVQSCLSDISKCTSIAYYKLNGSCETYGVLQGYIAQEITFPSTAKLYGVVINRDCTEVKQLWNGKSGMYDIKPCPSCSTYKVYCDMDTEDQGWTVLQRRRDGSVDFYRTWDEYADGFGDVCNEFWIGNDFIQKMTSSAVYELRIDLIDYDNSSLHATYESFRIESEVDKYRLCLGSYIDSQSNVGDSMTKSGDFQFSTKDEDNDNYVLNMADVYQGAWWFPDRMYAHLNGNLFSPMTPHTDPYHGISWLDYYDLRIQLRFSEMKIRRIG